MKAAKKTQLKPKTKETTTQVEGYTMTEKVITIGSNSMTTKTFEITDKNHFDAEKNLKGMYEKAKDKYKDKTFYIKILGPSGWYTVGSNMGLSWKGYGDYFDGRVEDASKFIKGIAKIQLIIK
jgi:hypothetical protein